MVSEKKKQKIKNTTLKQYLFMQVAWLYYQNIQVHFNNGEDEKETWISWLPTVCWFYWGVLVGSGCYNKNTINWVAYKEQAFIFQGFGGWEFQDHDTSQFGV